MSLIYCSITPAFIKQTCACHQRLAVQWSTKRILYIIRYEVLFIRCQSQIWTVNSKFFMTLICSHWTFQITPLIRSIVICVSGLLKLWEFIADSNNRFYYVFCAWLAPTSEIVWCCFRSESTVGVKDLFYFFAFSFFYFLCFKTLFSIFINYTITDTKA